MLKLCLDWETSCVCVYVYLFANTTGCLMQMRLLGLYFFIAEAAVLSFSLLVLICSSTIILLQTHMQCKYNIAICCCYITQTCDINYGMWHPPARQHGLLLWLEMGHSGHRSQSSYGSPAGFGSSGPMIDPSPAEQIGALLFWQILWWNWSNQTACMTG